NEMQLGSSKSTNRMNCAHRVLSSCLLLLLPGGAGGAPSEMESRGPDASTESQAAFVEHWTQMVARDRDLKHRPPPIPQRPRRKQTLRSALEQKPGNVDANAIETPALKAASPAQVTAAPPQNIGTAFSG